LKWHEPSKPPTASRSSHEAALKLALDALTDFDYDKRMAAIAAAKQALEQQDRPAGIGKVITAEWIEERAHRRCKRYIFIDTEAPYQFDEHTLMDLVWHIEAKLNERDYSDTANEIVSEMANKW